MAAPRRDDGGTRTILGLFLPCNAYKRDVKRRIYCGPPCMGGAFQKSWWGKMAHYWMFRYAKV